MKTLKFEDLTEYELELIKSMANDHLRNTPGWNPAKSLIKTVLDVVHAKGYDIIKSDREPTLEGPKQSWYEKSQPKKPWMY